MSETLIFPLVILLFLLFIFIMPSVLYAAVRKIADPVPWWFPLLLAAGVFFVSGGILVSNLIEKENVLAGTLVMFSLILLLTTIAVVTPYLWLGKKTGIARPWLPFTCLSFFAVALLFYSTMGHAYEGMPLPLFSPALPLTGWILDGLSMIFNLQEIVYSPANSIVHSLLLIFGHYLQALIMAAAYFGFMSMQPAMDNE